MVKSNITSTGINSIEPIEEKPVLTSGRNNKVKVTSTTQQII